MQLTNIPFGVTDWPTIDRTEHRGESGVAYWQTQHVPKPHERVFAFGVGVGYGEKHGSTLGWAPIRCLVLGVVAACVRNPAGATKFEASHHFPRLLRVSVVSPQLQAAGQLASEAVAAGIGPRCLLPDAAVELFDACEQLSRLADVARVDAIAAVHATSAYREDGHISAAAMGRHLGRWSGAEAARADKIRRMIVRCDDIDSAWRLGELSIDQAGVLARGFANPRVQEAFIERQDWLLKQAATKSFVVFERRIGDWLRLIDQDGPEPRPEPAHENRDASLIQDHFSKQWTFRGTFGSLQGDKLRRIFDAYVEAATLQDWESARELLGDAACRDDLVRTDGQRRADALEQIFADALHNPERSVPIDTVHDIVWSESSFEEQFRRFLGEEPAVTDPEEHRCHGLTGYGLNPAGAFADAVLSSFRRVVVNAAGVTLDMSRKQRFYTGLARLGVQINFDTCFWPGCDVPVTGCQIDHRESAACGGLTTQVNGGPCCQRHNRLKEAGYVVTRLPDGEIRITTPSGRVIPT